MQLSVEQIKSVSFDSIADFRTYNAGGYAELTERLERARNAYRNASSLQEKEIAQTRIESLENLWRLSVELARERFERAREGVAARLNDLENRVKSSRLPDRVQEELRARLSTARQAFLQKQFAAAEEALSAIESGLRQAPRRRMSVAIPPVVQRNPPRPLAAPEPVNLLELGHREEKSGSRAGACRAYVAALERQFGNVVTLRR